MKLNEVVNWLIYEYPTLFRRMNYEESRTSVLNHLFLVIGNGYRWHNDGYMKYPGVIKKHQTLDCLPEGYFEKRLLMLEVDPMSQKSPDDFICSLTRRLEPSQGYPSNIFSSRCHERRLSVVFESRGDEFDASIYEEFSRKESCISRLSRDALYAMREARNNSEWPIRPYPISQYSAISEIYTGIDLDKNPVKPRKDWLAGAVEIAKYAMWFIQDDQACRNDYHHPDKPSYMQRLLNHGMNMEGMNPGETVDEFAWRLWGRHKTKTVDFLTGFLNRNGDGNE